MTEEEFNKKNANFLSKIEESKKRKTPQNDFLDKIQNSLEKACELRVSFTVIQSALKSEFEQDISVATLKRYCIDKKIYKAKKHKKNPLKNKRLATDFRGNF